MSLRNKLMAWAMKRRGRALSPTKIIAVTFLILILTGAFLLTLPVATRDGQGCDFLRALFTATSATCVTGLTPFDTYTQWSGFGQGVLLCLIEVGGLGFMSMATLFVFLLRKRIGLKQRMVMAQALSLNDMEGVVRLQRTVIFGSLSVEALGAAIRAAYFTPRFGFWKALWRGVFHSVSAYTRLVLSTTGALLLAGWVLTCLLEWNNPDTLGNMPVWEKLLNGLFQSVTLRTAGFAAVDQGKLTEGGKAVSMIIMLIGGSSGSTAGGLKTVTFVVLVLFIWARLRGRSTVCAFRRTIPASQVLDAMTIAMAMLILAMFGAVFICATSPVGFTNALFEAISALATVGLTADTTLRLSVPAQWLIILYMYFGRVGILTISLGFLTGDRAAERFRYAQTSLLIG